MEVFVVGLDGSTHTVQCSQSTVDELMQRVEEVEGVPPSLQRLHFQGYELRPGHSLCRYNVHHHATVHLSMELDGGGLYGSRRILPSWYVYNQQICRNCYGRLSAAATRCPKAKCGRTTDIRPRKPYWR